MHTKVANIGMPLEEVIRKGWNGFICLRTGCNDKLNEDRKESSGSVNECLRRYEIFKRVHKLLVIK
jgi:hypothetical protein